MKGKYIAIGVVVVAVVVGYLVFTNLYSNETKHSDLKYDYEEQLYYTMEGAVPYGDDHLIKIKVWNSSDKMVDLPLNFKYVLSDGKEITPVEVGHKHHNYNGANLADSGFDPSLHTSLMSGEIERYECVIHVSGYNSKLDGELICLDEGWEHYKF